MKRLLILACFSCLTLAPAQLITLSKAVKTSGVKDRMLYKIGNTQQSEYLGEVEVDGFSADDAAVFSKVYEKAKTIGANSYTLAVTEGIDGSAAAFRPEHYRLNLYYTASFPKEDNVAYIFNLGEKPVKITVGGATTALQSRSYIKKTITYGGENYISTGKLLGSRIFLSAKEGQPAQYFMISALNIRPDGSGVGGLNIKSGDIVGLERSFANFLSAIYKQQNMEQF